MDAEDLREKFRAIKAADAKRIDFFESLIDRIAILTTERDEAVGKLEHTESFSKYLQSEIKNLKGQLQNAKNEMDCDPFILVLVDGDNTKFSDDYLRRSAFGGHDAARDLHKRIETYLGALEDFQPHWKIVVRVFANLNGLSKSYCDNRIADKPTFWQFVLGFNKEYDLCSYIDAGNDKEAADSNIKSIMRLFYRNVHCKHILFAGSNDSSYTAFFRQFTLTNEVCKRVTLVEAMPFTTSLKEISSKFLTTRFEGLFRDIDFPNRRDSPIQYHRAVTPPETPRVSYASTVSKGKDNLMELGSTTDFDTSSNLPPTPPPSAGPSARLSGQIPRNKYGYRVDQTVYADQKLIHQLKAKKLCNRFFLSSCPYEDCTHIHDAKLGPAELEALKVVARLSPCPRGAWCGDPSCVAGHRCVQDPDCTRGDNCRFGKEMHNVDMNIVEVVTV